MMEAAQDAESPFAVADGELEWQREMFRQFEAGNAHMFILYFNVYDYVFVPSLAARPDYVPLRLRDYLGRLFQSRGFEVVLYYSWSGGLVYLDQARMHPLVEKGVPERVRHACRQYGQTAPHERIPLLGESMVALPYIHRLLTCDAPAVPRTAVILEYLETIAPHEDSPRRTPEALFNVQLLHRLALDRRPQRQHLVVGLAPDLGQVDSSLYAAGSDCCAYRVPLPMEETHLSRPGQPLRRYRRDWLALITGRYMPGEGLTSPLAPLPAAGDDQAAPMQTGAAAPGDGDLVRSVEELAGQTSGFSYDNLRDLVYYAAQRREPVTRRLIQERKRGVITAESRDLLEVVEPKAGFEVIAGYDYVKEYLRVVRDAVRRQSVDPLAARIVPKGILFLGPPGTGKSFVASALAKETDFNMVKLKNIRSMWVGETERNLNRVLDLLSDMYPVIVFVDEIDAALGTREATGGGGGGGVEQRIFQRILEFMAMDEHRGRVLWVAASNRPDNIDAALLSRFDLVIPFLLPNEVARREMITRSFADAKKIGYTLQEEPAELFQLFLSGTQGFSGRELDTICRQAVLFAVEERLASGTAPVPELPLLTSVHLARALADFRQARDPHAYELQTLLAIRATNFYSFLPSREELPECIRSAEGSERPIDEAKLEERIAELKALCRWQQRP